METQLDAYVAGAARMLEIAGVSVVALGAALALAAFGVRLARRELFSRAYTRLRRELGQAILLGLELLVGADIIATVTTQPTLRSVAALGGIVLIRTFLSFSLEAEIEGQWPWQRRERGA